MSYLIFSYETVGLKIIIWFNNIQIMLGILFLIVQKDLAVN